MAYTQDFVISLGSSDTGLTLNAQIVDTVGADVGSAITAGFTEIGTGVYLLHCTTIPDGHRGAIKVYVAGAPTVIVGAVAINPADWTTEEKMQIRWRLGIDGDTEAAMTNTPNLGTVEAHVTGIRR